MLIAQPVRQQVSLGAGSNSMTDIARIIKSCHVIQTLYSTQKTQTHINAAVSKRLEAWWFNSKTLHSAPSAHSEFFLVEGGGRGADPEVIRSWFDFKNYVIKIMLQVQHNTV
jgi:hypothetical protein